MKMSLEDIKLFLNMKYMIILGCFIVMGSGKDFTDIVCEQLRYSYINSCKSFVRVVYRCRYTCRHTRPISVYKKMSVLTIIV